MNSSAEAQRFGLDPIRPGRPPIPHEHGAWIVLYAPMAITLLALHSVPMLRAALLFVAVTGLFLARNAIGLLARRRGREGTGFWAGIYLALAAAGTLPLLMHWHLIALLDMGGVMLPLFALHTALLLAPAKRRLDRSQWGEILAVGALALTAPAAYIVVRGHPDRIAWLLWMASALYFSSGIFLVKMLLAAAKVRSDFGWRERLRIGRDHLIYHLLLGVALAVMMVWIGGSGAILILIAYLPALIRAMVWWTKLTNRLPPLKRVGWMETVYALWFSGFLIAVCRVSGVGCRKTVMHETRLFH